MIDLDLCFSVCIPTYNRGYIIENTLNSLLNQTYKNFEVLVIDDGSIDNTEDVCLKYEGKLNLRYLKKKNGGKHTALNLGIKEAKGKFFIILDAKSQLYKSTLEQMYSIWERKIPDENKDEFCGIIGKSSSQDGNVSGILFPREGYYLTYIDFHFGQKSMLSYGDCCECIRTDILKQYSFPEPEGTKFIPEYYIFDQIGCNYKLYCTNSTFKYNIYLPDGITVNQEEYYKKNALGILYGAIIRIDIVFYKAKISFGKKFSVWLDYWTYKDISKNIKNAPKAKHITFVGAVAKVYYTAHKLLRRSVAL